MKGLAERMKEMGGKGESRKAVDRYVVGVRNRAYPASLELRKIYRTIPDEKAGRRQFLRIVDESGEDYLYPEQYFLPIELPKSLKKALQLAS